MPRASRSSFADDGYLTVTDNGRGIPVDPHPKFRKKSALEVIMTTLHSGGKFDSKVYATSRRPARRRRVGGQRAVGASGGRGGARAEALSPDATRAASPTGKLEKLGQVKNRRGTKVRFKPDPEIFGKDCAFEPARLFRMARSKAYLFGGVEIRWICDPRCASGTRRRPESAVFHFPGGLKDFLADRIDGQEPASPTRFSPAANQAPAATARSNGRSPGSAATTASSSYCNTMPTPEGGTHEAGFAPR